MLFTGNTCLAGVAFMERKVNELSTAPGVEGIVRPSFGDSSNHTPTNMHAHATKISAKQLVSNWAVSFVGNLVGAIGLAALCTYAGVFSDAVPGIVKVSARKGALPFGVAFARGVLCNW